LRLFRDLSVLSEFNSNKFSKHKQKEDKEGTSKERRNGIEGKRREGTELKKDARKRNDCE